MANRKVYSTGGRYGTRMMTAGEPMVLTGPAARAAIATGKATAERPRKRSEEAGVPAPAPVEIDERAALRAAYKAKTGKNPFGGWSAEVLREKIAAA